MKILFLTENFPPETNAAATRVFERGLYWAKWGHQVTILTSAPNFPKGKLFNGYNNCWRNVEIMDGLRVVRVKTYIAVNQGTFRRTLDFLSFMFSSFFIGLFEQRPDVIVATSPQFFAAVGGWFLAAVRRIPFVFELGDLWPASIVAVGAFRPGQLIQLIEKIELFLYRRADAIVALTDAFKKDLIFRGIYSGKIAVVINGVDNWRYGPRDNDKALEKKYHLKNKFVLGYMGTLGMAHGLTNVLDAATLLVENKNICFLFVGGGADLNTLVEEAKARNLPNVVFMPPQPKAVMPDVWSLCDIALVHLKSEKIFEGVIPSKIFEAMAMGLPILIVSPKGEASKIICQEKAGIHVPAENPIALAGALEKLYFDEQERGALASQSFQASFNYSRSRQAHHMIDVLNMVVEGNGKNVEQLISKYSRR